MKFFEFEIYIENEHPQKSLILEVSLLQGKLFEEVLEGVKIFLPMLGQSVDVLNPWDDGIDVGRVVLDLGEELPGWGEVGRVVVVTGPGNSKIP